MKLNYCTLVRDDVGCKLLLNWQCDETPQYCPWQVDSQVLVLILVVVTQVLVNITGLHWITLVSKASTKYLTTNNPQLRSKNTGTNYVINEYTLMYYGSGTGDAAALCAEQTLCVHSPGGSTFLHEMMCGLHLDSVTPSRKSNSVSRWVCTWKTLCQISSQFDLKQWSFRLFWRGFPNN